MRGDARKSGTEEGGREEWKGWGGRAVRRWKCVCEMVRKLRWDEGASRLREQARESEEEGDRNNGLRVVAQLARGMRRIAGSERGG